MVQSHSSDSHLVTFICIPFTIAGGKVTNLVLI